MAIESRIKIVGQVISGPEGAIDINTSEFVNSDAPLATTQVNLQAGDNTILVPTKSRGVIMFFDPASTQVKKIKGAGGDTGVQINKTGIHYLQFDAAPPASFIINSVALDGALLSRFVFV